MQKGGHFVPNNQIEELYNGSAANLNKHYKDFDFFIIIDNTDGDNRMIAKIEKGNNEVVENIPFWIQEHVPEL